MTLLDYFISLNFDDKATGKMKAFNQVADTGAKYIKGFAVAFSGAVFAVERFVNTTTRSLNQFQDVAKRTNIAMEDLQKWTKAGQQIDLQLSSEQILGDIQTLQQKLDNLKMGRGDFTPFAMLGIDPQGKNAIQVLEQLQGVVKTMDGGRARTLLADLGVDNLYNVLKSTRGEFEALAGGRFLDQKQRDDITKGALAIKKVKINLIELKDQAVARLMPPLTLLMERFFIWLNQNGDQVIDVLEKTFKGMMVLAGSIARVGEAIGRFINFLFKTRSGLTILLAGLAIWASRLKPLTLLLTGLFLVLDDILAFMQGAPSLIGKFVDAFDLEKVIKGLAIVLTTLGAIYTIWKGIAATKVGGKILDVVDAKKDQMYYDKKNATQPNTTKGATKAKGGFGFGKVLSALTGFMFAHDIANEGKAGGNDASSWLKTIGGGAGEGALIGGTLGSVVPGIGNVVGAVGGGILGAGYEGISKLLKEKNASIQANQTINNNITQNINGNADANQVATATTTAIEDMLDGKGFIVNNNDYLD